MLAIRPILWIIPIAAMVFAFSCSDSTLTPDEESDFYVTVHDYRGNDLEGVRIHGGIDWDYFSVFTDSSGKALLPKHAHGLRAIFGKNNYFTKSVEELTPDVYVLYPTPYIMTEIGDVTGQAVKFTASQITAINYDGKYRVYNYDENGVTQELLADFPYGARRFRLERDTLWFSTYDGYIYAYSMTDPFNPALMLQLDIDEGSFYFDRQDSLLAVGTYYGGENEPLRILSYRADGSINEFYRIENFIVNQIFFVSEYLVTLGFYHNYLAVFDASNLSDVRLAYVDYYSAENSLLWGDTLVLAYEYGSGDYRYQMVEFSNPLDPQILGGFLADGQITGIINDSLAVGRYCTYTGDYGSLCVFEGSFESFQAIAILSDVFGPEHQGCRPPYFIMGGKLWRLEENQYTT